MKRVNCPNFPWDFVPLGSLMAKALLLLCFSLDPGATRRAALEDPGALVKALEAKTFKAFTVIK